MDANTNPESSRPRPEKIDTAYDEPYQFGRRPNTRAPYPFTERQFARLLILRSRLDAAPTDADLPEVA
jgi:hypothetical protein